MNLASYSVNVRPRMNSLNLASVNLSNKMCSDNVRSKTTPMPKQNYKWIMVTCIRTISRVMCSVTNQKANVLQKLQHSAWTAFPFLVLHQYFRVTRALSLQPRHPDFVVVVFFCGGLCVCVCVCFVVVVVVCVCFVLCFLPALLMVHGKARHPQSQGSVERSNGDRKDMLVIWLADNSTHDWVTGITLVQFQKNSANHSGTKRSPYSALFGEEVCMGLTTSSLPQEVLSNPDNEEDLAVIMNHSSEFNFCHSF